MDVYWKINLGSGETNVPGKGLRVWKGAGWTGQPLIVLEHEIPYIIQGCYDHTLKKINAQTGEVIWKYSFDDVLKGTGTICRNPKAKDPLNSIIVLQGSRRGTHASIGDKKVYSYRAISYFTGQELWRLNSERTYCYSRDVDASALVINDTAYVPLENGKFTVFNPFETSFTKGDTVRWNTPKIIQQTNLFTQDDVKKHRGNIVSEASPTRLKDRVYIASGSGHVYGYSLSKDSIDWDFYIGADMDGSVVVTADNCLIVTVEKQYIKGNGGVFKLDPSKKPDSSVVWYYPLPDIGYAEWKGGVIGSASVNDYFISNQRQSLVAFNSVDGNLYVVKQFEYEDSLTYGPNKKNKYRIPKLVFKNANGPSISTPIFTKDRLISAGYSRVSLFSYDSLLQFKKLSEFKGSFEATPSVYNGCMYLASRNGNLYCFGKPKKEFVPNTIELSHELIAEKQHQDTSLLVMHSKSKEVIEEKKLERPVDNVLIPVKPKPKSEADTPKRTSISEKHSYHLIAGAFGVDGNAEKLVTQFEQKGISAIVLPKTGKMTYVSVGSSDSRENLLHEQKALKTSNSISTWILKR